MKRPLLKALLLLAQGAKNVIDFIPNFFRMIAAVAILWAFTPALAEYFHWPRPSLGVCANAVIVLEVVGYVVRGNLSYFFTERNRG